MSIINNSVIVSSDRYSLSFCALVSLKLSAQERLVQIFETAACLLESGCLIWRLCDYRRYCITWERSFSQGEVARLAERLRERRHCGLQDPSLRTPSLWIVYLSPRSLVSLAIFFTIIPKLENMNHSKYKTSCTKCTHTTHSGQGLCSRRSTFLITQQGLPWA